MCCQHHTGSLQYRRLPRGFISGLLVRSGEEESLREVQVIDRDIFHQHRRLGKRHQDVVTRLGKGDFVQGLCPPGDFNGVGAVIKIRDRVVADILAEYKPVRPEAPGEQIIPGTAFERVLSTSTVQGIIAASAKKFIMTATTVKIIPPLAAVEKIVVLAAKQYIVTPRPPQGVRAGVPFQGILTPATDETIVTGSSEKRVMPPTSVESIRPFATVEKIGAVLSTLLPCYDKTAIRKGRDAGIIPVVCGFSIDLEFRTDGNPGRIIALAKDALGIPDPVG